MRDSLLGIYRAFLEKQIPVDFVSCSALDAARLRQYKVVFFPYPVMLSESAGNLLKEHVENGGTIVAEARLVWNDERGHASPVIPGFGLDRVFGAHEILIRPEEKPKIVVQRSADLPGLSAGLTLPGAAFEEQLEASKEARTLASFSSGEAVMRRRPDGRTAGYWACTGA